MPSDVGDKKSPGRESAIFRGGGLGQDDHLRLHSRIMQRDKKCEIRMHLHAKWTFSVSVDPHSDADIS